MINTPLLHITDSRLRRLGLSAAVFACITFAAAAADKGVEFPPLRHGIKAVFGANGNDHGGDLDGYGKKLVQAFHDLKADLTRVEFKWAIIEDQRGTYDWTEPDRLIQFLHDNGVEPMLMLYCAPKWAMRGTPADEELFIARNEENLHTVVWPRRECLPDFERFCEAAARRYAGKARLFEFWNEPDGMAGPIVLHDKSGKAVDVRYGGDAREYTYWLKRMYTAVKKGNPEARVAAGSLCVHDTKFIEAMYASGCADFCDAISLHPYADKGINVEWVKQCRQVMEQYGDWTKHVWLSEFGWQSKGQYDEKKGWDPSAEEHAKRITQTFKTIVELPYITQSYFFTLNDWNTSETGIDPTGSHCYGVADLNLNRRPGFEAFAKVVAETPQKPRLITPPASYFIPPAGAVDLASDRVEFACIWGKPGLNLTAEHPGLSGTFEAPSLLKKNITFDTKKEPKSPESGWTVSSSTAQGKSTLTWLRSAMVDSLMPGPHRAVFHPAQGAPTEFLITVPAKAVRFEASPAINGELSDWPKAFDIEEGKMRANFGWDDQRMYFAARIEDQTHQQPHTGKDLWKGDCIQLAFDPQRDGVRGSRYDDNDSELAIALTKNGPAIQRFACAVDSYVGELPAAWLAVNREGNITTYEFALSWSELGITAPKQDQLIGVAVAGLDYEGEKRTVHKFGDGIIAGKEPYRFASIRLEK